MPGLEIDQLGRRAQQLIDELAAISAETGRLVRLFLSPEHRRAADLVAGWMKDIGLDVDEDALGTVRGRWRGRDETGRQDNARRLLIGSHLDTVIDAGKYDGPLGVIAGLLAAEHFIRADRRFPFGIDVLAFGDEEGSRFPTTLSSSSAAAGAFDEGSLALRDDGGVSLGEALKAYGKDPSGIAGAAYARDEAAAYIEVHIEQGPLLEHEDEPLGVVTGIVGQTRLRFVVEGVAGHAGTVPMEMRHDALAGAAEIVLATEALAREHAAERMVATVGRIEALPGAVNVIPARVTFTVDLRAMSDKLRREAVTRLKAEAWRLVEARGLTVSVEPFLNAEATPCDPKLQYALAGAIEDIGHRPIHMPSGAGHDAQEMAKLCPSAMMFVRCRGGVSHNPAEYASPADMGRAVAALIAFVERFERDELYRP